MIFRFSRIPWCREPCMHGKIMCYHAMNACIEAIQTTTKSAKPVVNVAQVIILTGKQSKLVEAVIVA